MTQELIKKESNEVALNPDVVRQAKIISGESTKTYIPFIPMLKINNRKKIVKTIIDGTMQDVEVAPEEGFLLLTKNKETKEYEEKFFSKELSAVVLKARYLIQSKFNEESPYFSNEFDDWNEIIKIYDKNNKNIIAEGTYSQLKDLFKIEERDSAGRNKKSFELFLVLYIDIDGEVYRFRSKMSSYNNWFDYKNSFGENDTHVAYKTNFKLQWSKEGQIGFWYVIFEKGEMVDLSKELILQQELQIVLNLTNVIKNQSRVSSNEIQKNKSQESFIYVDNDKGSEDIINTDQIPF